MTVAIVYTAGSYGTYLEWCLTSLTTTNEIVAPFTSVGNSHQFDGNYLDGVKGWQKYLSSTQKYSFVRLHPKNTQHDNLSIILDYICNTSQSAIYLYPDPDSVLLCVNNYLTKVWDNWWDYHLKNYIDKRLIYENWPVSRNTKIDQIPLWIQREFLSFYLMPSWFDQIEWNHLERWSHPNVCAITIKDLLFDFEKTLGKIQKHCGSKFIRPVSDLIPYHNNNIRLQANLGQDQLCQDIVNSTISNQDLDWGTLPFGSEIWIQWRLRELGFEIECHGLDIFPTNSVQLKELLYPI